MDGGAVFLLDLGLPLTVYVIGELKGGGIVDLYAFQQLKGLPVYFRNFAGISFFVH